MFITHTQSLAALEVVPKKSTVKNDFKSDAQFMKKITSTELTAVVGQKSTQRKVKRLSDDGLKYLTQKQINL